MRLSIARTTILGAALLSATACVSGANPTMMSLTVATSGAAPVNEGHPGFRQMSVANVQGGTETNPLVWSEVSNEDFQRALEVSLRAFNYLVLDGAASKFKVTASIIDVQKPLAGFDMSVTMRVRYSVITEQGATVFDDTIAVTGTAAMTEAFMGSDRLRIGIEKAAKANIEVFLGRLAKELK